MKILIVAGGTGGHLFPGIAVAEALKEIDPAVRVSFVSTGRELDREILEKCGFSGEILPVGRLKGEGVREKIRTVLNLPRAFRKGRGILKRLMPAMVFGIGGYLSGPMILAAFFKRIPRAILEPNSIPGLTNRILARFVNRIFTAFPDTARFFPRSKVRLTGTPVRHDLTEVGRMSKEGRGDFTVLVIGGSQGATALNRAFVDLLPCLEASGRPFRIVHQTGKADFESVREAYAKSRIRHRVSPFIPEMAEAYREADLVVSRAGASTIAELIETRSPSILVPYPFAADDHQRFNAMPIVSAGGAEMILNQELDRLGERLIHYESHREELARMREGLSRLRLEPAARQVARECLAMVGGGSVHSERARAETDSLREARRSER